MTPEQRQLLGTALTTILQDNLGNKLTVALANGILLQLDQSLQVEVETKGSESGAHPGPVE